MEKLALEASHLKHLMICIELNNQYISYLPVRIQGQMNHWITDKHPSK